MFVLNIIPEQGFVNGDTNVIFKFGMTKEECLDKILNDDSKFVQDLVQKEDEINTTNLINTLTIEDRELNNSHSHSHSHSNSQDGE